MSAVVSFVSDVVGGAVDIVGDVIEGVGDLVEDVGEAVSDAGSWIDDNVLQPALDDPIKTIATIAAVATGNPQLIPYINAADVAAKGGDLEDIGKAYVVSSVAQGAGKLAASEIALAATGAQYGIDAASQQAAMLAAQEAGMNTFVDFAATAGGSAAGAATGAALSGQDPFAAAIIGGVSGAVSGGVRYGAEELLGSDISQSTAGKIGTQLVGQAAKAEILPAVAKAVIDPPDRQPRQQAAREGTGTSAGIAAGTSELASADYEMKKYVNDDGGVLYINFKNGEPQQTIPPGYREEKLGELNIADATKPQLEPTTPYEMPAAKGGLASRKRKSVVKYKKGLAVKKK